MTSHPSESQLNELLDGTLDAREKTRVQRHVSECAPCASTLRSLETVVRRARALSRDLTPPRDVWDEVRRVRRGGARLPSAGRPAAHARWRTFAAAAALVVASSVTTWWVVDGRPSAVGVTPPAVEAASPAALAAFAPVEARYVLAASALRATLDERRDVLDPATVRAVERSLTTIDDAIAEARAALARDPADATLTRLLASSYEQKVTLLRRASELPPRS